MVSRFRGSDCGTQPVLLPIDARDLLPQDHPVWQFIKLVDELDLTAIRAAYNTNGEGGTPYDPTMMVTLLLYCHHQHWHHSREIAARCLSDLGCRIITGNQRPSHETINRFRRRHDTALQGLLVQSVRLCHQAGLINLDVIAGDGTKVGANASMRANLDQDELTAKIQELTETLAQQEAAWQASIATGTGTGTGTDQPALFDPDPDPGQAPAPDGHGLSWRRMQRTRGQIAAYEVALQVMATRPDTAGERWRATHERAQAKVVAAQQRVAAVRAELTAAAARRAAREAAGHRIPGPRPVPVEDHARLRAAVGVLERATARAQATAATAPKPPEVNVTDPSSRIMPGKHGGYDQLFNVQATACPGPIILAIGRHPNANDVQALPELLHTTRANCDAAGIEQRIGTALFDAGYASDANFTTTVPVAKLLVTLGPGSPDSPPRQQMAVQLADPANKAVRRRRGAIIEPVFAQLFQQFGRTLILRGDDVDTELHLWAASHNFAKLIRHRQRQHASAGS